MNPQPLGQRIRLATTLFSTLPLVLLAVFWMSARWAGTHDTSIAWIELARWGARHGLRDLQKSTRFVTLAVTLLAASGAVLRMVSVRGHGAVRRVGLVATCAPLCVLLPEWGAAAFLAGVFLVAVMPHQGNVRLGSSAFEITCREAFPLLSACCFVAFSRDYNADLLTRALLVAAGLALILRAALPSSAKA